MSRLVVMQFSDDDQAEAFVKNIQRFQKSIEGQEERWGMPEEGGKVVGLFAMPTIFCDNSGAGGCSDRRRVRGWVRGKKFGWWVCVVCHKPSNAGGLEKLFRAVVSQGVNLLHPQGTLQQPASVFDEGFGALNRD